jgi:hypothetical protein
MDVFGFLLCKPKHKDPVTILMYLDECQNLPTANNSHFICMSLLSQDYFSPPPLEPVVRRSPSPAPLLQPLRVRMVLSTGRKNRF